MTRARNIAQSIQSGLVILTLVLLSSTANAEKQKMCVLGIEAAVGQNTRIEPEDTRFAKELTKELKARAQLSAQYVPVKEHRELVDEKLMNNCGSEAASCMAPIGESMGCDVILFGSVKNSKNGWVVNLKLHNIKKKPPAQVAWDKDVPIETKESTGAGLANWVKDRMRKLTGEIADGTLIVKVPGVDSGKILVNNEVKDQIRSGQATLTLPEGRYKIGVDADGFDLFNQDVTISADKPYTMSPDLKKKDKPDDKIEGTGTTGTDNILSVEGTRSNPPKGNGLRTAAKVTAGVALVGSAALGGVWIYSWRKTKYTLDAPLDTDGNGMPDLGTRENPLKHSHCDGRSSLPLQGNDKGEFDEACKAYNRTTWLPYPTIGLALVGVGALAYVMMTSDNESKETNARGRQKKRKNLIVTPVVTPDGTGATLRFDW